MSFHTELIETTIGTCPDCGCDQDLYKKPINVKVYVCCNCEKEYSEDYMEGFNRGLTHAYEPKS